MSKSYLFVFASLCLAVIAAVSFSSCSSSSGASSSSSRSRPLNPHDSVTATRNSSLNSASRAGASSRFLSRPQRTPVVSSPSPNRVAATRRTFRPGSLFAWIFQTDDRRGSARSRAMSRARSRRDSPRSAPQRPAVPATQVDHAVLAKSNRSNTRVVIDVGDQKGYLLVNNEIAIEAPVSTARPGKSTPRGTFRMGQRVRTGKISTIYGVAMPYWMRLGGSVYGVHAGYLPGYPASAGCIRLPNDAARLIFDNTKSGTRVSIYSSWNQYGG